MPFGGITDSDEPDLLQTGLFMLPNPKRRFPMSVAVNRTSFGGPMRPDNPFKQYEPDRLKNVERHRGYVGRRACRCA